MNKETGHKLPRDESGRFVARRADLPTTGTVISGTLLLEDLIPALLEELRGVCKERYDGLVKEYVEEHDWPSDGEGGLALGDQTPVLPDPANFLLDDLFDIINEYAPTGYYFGAHPGDGSDFGYWAIDWGD